MQDASSPLPAGRARAPSGAERSGEFTPAQERLLFLALGLGQLMATLDQTMCVVALSDIQRQLTPRSLAPWVISLFILTSGATYGLFGALSQVFGRAPSFQVSLWIFIVFSVVAGFAVNMNMLLAARAMQGVGAGGILALTQIVAADAVAPVDRGYWQVLHFIYLLKLR